MQEKLKEAAFWLKEAERVIALTGAGISTPSGIPDFRSPGTGLWEKVSPEEVATIWAYREDPIKVLSFLEPLSGKLREAKPNPAHFALAELEKKGKCQAVITQNIDRLHQKAGSKKVIELHGNAEEAICLKCHSVYSAQILQSFLFKRKNPLCKCGGLIKPNVVFFGEALPQKALAEAFSLAERADCCLVVGSSLTVQPASLIPQLTLDRGGRVIILNLQPTYLDTQSLVLPYPVEETLPELVRLLIT